MSFENYARPGRCEVCGKKTDVVVGASTMGAVSFAYCKDCLEAGAEPYGAMVSYIACAGRFPDDIHESYREIVRSTLAYLGKSEEQFIAAVDSEIREMDELYALYANAQEEVENNGFGDSAGGWHEDGGGWNPNGEFCGECSNSDCSRCGVWEDRQQ